mmetsp:Transcript_9288/g.29551  ORF Transcript_9288/g.29551 Transcript_9288/m.29551 type:complete len:248 (+) Transcript_9288:400-1143(+)
MSSKTTWFSRLPRRNTSPEGSSTSMTPFRALLDQHQRWEPFFASIFIHVEEKPSGSFIISSSLFLKSMANPCQRRRRAHCSASHLFVALSSLDRCLSHHDWPLPSAAARLPGLVAVATLSRGLFQGVSSGSFINTGSGKSRTRPRLAHSSLGRLCSSCRVRQCTCPERSREKRHTPSGRMGRSSRAPLCTLSQKGMRKEPPFTDAWSKMASHEFRSSACSSLLAMPASGPWGSLDSFSKRAIVAKRI